MARLLLVAMSVVVLVVGLVLTASSRRASYTLDEVVGAFAASGFSLEPLPTTTESASGWTGYAPLQPPAYGTLLLDQSNGDTRFYVFVADSDDRAREFFAPLTDAGGGAGVFDRLQGNVVVSSDASLTDTGLGEDERRRIDAALGDLVESD